MIAVCRRTSFVVITPQIAICRRLRNSSCHGALATRVPPSESRPYASCTARSNPLGSAQDRGISRYLQILPEVRQRDAAVIAAPLAPPPCNFDRDSPARRADRLHSPRLTMLWRKSRQSVEFMARRTTRRGRGNLEAG